MTRKRTDDLQMLIGLDDKKLKKIVITMRIAREEHQSRFTLFFDVAFVNVAARTRRQAAGKLTTI